MGAGITRREVLKGAAGAALAGGLAACARIAGTPPEGSVRMPVAFLSHGSPMLAISDDPVVEAWSRTGKTLPRPRAIVVISAHWEESVPVRVTAMERPGLVYDFGGFPDALSRVAYPCPGDPALADRITERLCAAGIPAIPEPERGLDHGVWVPLVRAYPAADIPVVSVSLPEPRSPDDLFALGRALSFLRDEKVLILGSGGVVHNLSLTRRAGPGDVDDWARAFDDWVRDRLAARDDAGLLDYAARAPHADLAVPTTEHFDPLLAVLGAARPEDRVADVTGGFRGGNLSMRGFLLA